MDPEQIERIRGCFDALAARTPELVDRFHTRLLAQHPAMRPLFPRDLGKPKQDFASGLRLVLKNLHRLDSIASSLMDLGARQFRSGVTPAHYGIARDLFLSTVREMSAATWSDDLAADLAQALNAVASVMIRGAGRARASAA